MRSVKGGHADQYTWRALHVGGDAQRPIDPTAGFNKSIPLVPRHGDRGDVLIFAEGAIERGSRLVHEEGHPAFVERAVGPQ